MAVAALSVFLITLALGQLVSTYKGLRAASLVGPSRLAGYGLGALLLGLGVVLLPPTWLALLWAVPAGPVVVVLLLLGGSFIAPPPHPDHFFDPNHPAHGGSIPVQIPDGDDLIPGILLKPLCSAPKEGGLAVCLVPGAGDNKVSFKWRLVGALLAEGLTVLTIDTPGHGDYRHRPMRYPDCLSVVPAAVSFLQAQPGVSRVGLLGISMGGALSLRSLVERTSARNQVAALAVLEVPIELNYSRGLVYREFWNSLRAPILPILKEISVLQIRQSWLTGGYRSLHSTTELIALLNPLESIGRLGEMPILLVYSARDLVAPVKAGRALHRNAPRARLLISKESSHVTLILMPAMNRQIARWLREQLY